MIGPSLSRLKAPYLFIDWSIDDICLLIFFKNLIQGGFYWLIPSWASVSSVDPACHRSSACRVLDTGLGHVRQSSLWWTGFDTRFRPGVFHPDSLKLSRGFASSSTPPRRGSCLCTSQSLVSCSGLLLTDYNNIFCLWSRVHSSLNKRSRPEWMTHFNDIFPR